VTDLGVEFVKTSLLTCLWPNEPPKKEKRWIDHLPLKHVKNMGDVSSVKIKVQKKEVQNNYLIQNKWQVKYKKLKTGNTN